MKGSQPSGNTTTTTTSPTAQAQLPYLQFGFGQAQNLYNGNPLQYYPGQTLAPVTDQTYQGLDLMQNRALTGSPVNQASQGFLTNLENGNLLSAGNPYFSNMANSVAAEVLPRIYGQAAADGRMGSPGTDFAASQGLGTALGNIAYQNYGNTLGDMTRALFNAPSIANQDYTDINSLLGVGSTLQGLQQPYINEDMARYQFNQMAPWQKLGLFMGDIGNPVPGSSSTTSPYFTNPLGSLLGAGTTLFGGSGISGKGPSLFSNTLGSNGLNLFGGLSSLFGSGDAAAAATPAAGDALAAFMAGIPP